MSRDPAGPATDPVEIPGLSGGPALRVAARWVGSTGRLLRPGR